MITKINTLLLGSAIILSCGAPKQDHLSTNDSTAVRKDSVESSPLNRLTPEEVQNGWKLLFDGKTMQGWRVYKNMENDSWEVKDGTLHCKPFRENETNKRADILTVDQYENFELAFDWMISPQGNSGVMFRVTEEFDQPYASGPEYQVIDDEGYPGDLQKGQLSGANYDMHFPAAETKVNPPGDWNESKLVVNNNHVEHWLNGLKVVEYELFSDEWKKRKAQSKWKDFPGYGMAKKGHIDLQDHTNEAWFRNIKIKPL
jgi:hypothetical protein